MKWSLFLPLEVYLSPVTPGSPLTNTGGNKLSRKPAALVFHCCVTKYHKIIVGGSDSKESAYNVGDPGSIPGSGRSPGEGNGNPLQYSCLENSMDREAQWTTVHGVTKSQTQLSNEHFHFSFFHSVKQHLHYLLVFFSLIIVWLDSLVRVLLWENQDDSK